MHTIIYKRKFPIKNIFINNVFDIKKVRRLIAKKEYLIWI